MDARELNDYLHRQIPVSRAMQVVVEQAGLDRVVLRAPLEPNLNHRHTAFGGSIAALATLAAWALLHLRLKSQGLAPRLVIQRNAMSYERPIDAAFIATAEFADDLAWQRFLAVLHRKRRARISVIAQVRCDGELAARFEGDFVALDEGSEVSTTK